MGRRVTSNAERRDASPANAATTTGCQRDAQRLADTPIWPPRGLLIRVFANVLDGLLFSAINQALLPPPAPGRCSPWVPRRSSSPASFLLGDLGS